MCYNFLARLIHLIFARKITISSKKKLKINRARKLERIASPSNQTVSVDRRNCPYCYKVGFARVAMCLDFLG